MKHNILYYIVMLAMATVAIGSCNREKFAEQNISSIDLSLTHKGNVLISYEPLGWQIGYNPSCEEYRIHDDTMGKYFILRYSQKPTYQGQTLKASLEYTTSNNIIRENNLNFVVQKTDDTGRVWLWNKGKKYGIVVKQL